MHITHGMIYVEYLTSSVTLIQVNKWGPFTIHNCMSSTQWIIQHSRITNVDRQVNYYQLCS